MQEEPRLSCRNSFQLPGKMSATYIGPYIVRGLTGIVTIFKLNRDNLLWLAHYVLMLLYIEILKKLFTARVLMCLYNWSIHFKTNSLRTTHDSISPKSNYTWSFRRLVPYLYALMNAMIFCKYGVNIRI